MQRESRCSILTHILTLEYEVYKVSVHQTNSILYSVVQLYIYIYMDPDRYYTRHTLTTIPSVLDFNNQRFLPHTVYILHLCR